MSDLKHRKSAVVDVPGLSYFISEAEKPVKMPPQAPVTALEQMYGYFEG